MVLSSGRLGAASLASLAIAWSVSAQSPEPLKRVGAHFAVEFHAGKLPAELGARLADEALAAAESAWPVLERLLGVRAGEPHAIHLHLEHAPFREVEKRLSLAKVPVEAVGEPAARASHILMWPPISVMALEQIGLPKTTANNILFHAARSVIATQAATPIDDPWFAEVVAYYVLEAVTNPTGAYGIDAAYDTRRWRAWYWRRDAPSELKRFVTDVGVPTIRIDWDVQQGTRALVAQLLATTGAGWARKLLAKPKKVDGGTADVRVAAVEAVLGSDWGKSDARLAKLCNTVRPAWLVLAPEFVLRKNRWLLVGASNASAAVSPAELRPPKGDYAVRGRFTMEGLNAAQVRVQLDWDTKSLVSVSFFPDKVVLALGDEKGKPTDISSFPASIQLGRAFEVSLEVAGPDLRIVVDGKELTSWTHGRGMRGEWGITCGDTLVWVDGLRAEPLAKSRK